MSEKVYHKAEMLSCESCDGSGISNANNDPCGYCNGQGARPRRLDGYYIGFEPTGNHHIDKILGAVACAGKSYHHTDCWNDETEPREDHTGRDPNEWIQNAANEAAKALTS